jgi:hypothetical protein
MMGILGLLRAHPTQQQHLDSPPPIISLGTVDAVRGSSIANDIEDELLALADDGNESFPPTHPDEENSIARTANLRGIARAVFRAI